MHDGQDWAGTEAANLRCMLTHVLYLCKKAKSSRSPKVRFLKEFLLDLKLKGAGGQKIGS